MITYSIIKKSQLEGAHRLDSEYYQPEYFELEKRLLAFKVHKRLLDIISRPVVTGSTPKDRDCKMDDTDIRFIKTDTLRDGVINFEFSDCLPIEQNRKNSQPESGDILVTIIGATHSIVGRTALIFDDDPDMNINQNIVLIRPDHNHVSSGYLEAFLRGRFGRRQLWRHSRQTEQVNLNCREVEQVIVPIVDVDFQKEIDQLGIQSRKFISESKDIYSQAEQMLLEELALQDFESDNALYTVVKLSETQEVARIDAEYFERKYERLEKKLQENKARKLGDLVSVKKGVEPGSEAYQEEGKLFIRVSSISKDGVNEQDQKYLSDDLYNELKENYEPKLGEILLTKDATPGIAYVLKENIEGIISGGILRLKLKEDIDAEYLALCLNLIVGQMQAQRDAGGSIIKHWKPDQIKQVLIPILPKPTQQKIADLVRKSHEARKKAKELLEQAKRTVEQLIEGEDDELKSMQDASGRDILKNLGPQSKKEYNYYKNLKVK